MEDDEEEEEEEDSESGGTTSLITAIVATLVAFGIGLYTAWSKSASLPPQTVMSYRLQATFGFLVTVVVAAAVLAAIIAFIARAMHKPFGRVFALAYSILVLGAAAFGAFGGHTSKIPGFGFLNAPAQVRPEAQVAQQNAVEKAPEKTPTTTAANSPTAPTKPQATGPPVQPVLPAPSPNGNASGDAKRVQDLTQGIVTELTSAQNDYLKDLEKAGLTRLLDPKRLSADQNFNESRAIITQVKSAIKRARDRINKAVSDIPGRVQALHLNEEFAKGIISGVQQSLSQTTPLLNQKWDLEEEIAEHFEEVINFMQANQGHWGVNDGKFVFERNSDLNRFNELMKQINDCATRQVTLQKEMVQNASKTMEDMKKAAQ